MLTYEVEVREQFYRPRIAESRVRLRLHALSGHMPSPTALEAGPVLRALAIHALRSSPDPTLADALPHDMQGKRAAAALVDRTPTTLTLDLRLDADVRRILSPNTSWTCQYEGPREPAGAPDEPPGPERV